MTGANLSFTATNHHPYYILTERYSRYSSGTRVAYHLCHALNELGFEAYVISPEPVLNLRTPFLTLELRNKHKKEKRHPIAIYTEIVEGNPLNGDVVVRWVNNTIGNIGLPLKFGENDIVCYASPLFVPENKNAPTYLGVVALPSGFQSVDLGRSDSKRDGFCYYAHKYLRDYGGKIAEKIKNCGISLCQDIPRTQLELWEILRHSTVLYVYEPSAIIGESLLCGCPVVMVSTSYSDSYSKVNRPQHHYYQTEADIEIGQVPQNAIDAMLLFREKFDAKVDKCWKSIEAFVEATQAVANVCNTGEESPEYTQLLEFCATHKYVYIYGAGNIGQSCKNLLLSYGIKNVKGFVVSDTETSELESELFGISIYSFSCLPNTPSECGIILAMRMCYRDEVLPDIKAVGYDYLNYYVVSR